MSKFCRHCRLDFEPSMESCPQCGTPLTLKNDSIFQGRYRIVRLLTETSLSQIYMAKDEAMNDRFVVLKVLFKDDDDKDAPKTSTHREQQIAAKVSHPNLVTIYEIGLTDTGEHYLAMEYLQGYTLAEVIKLEGRMEFIKAATIMSQICDALGAIHKAGFIHKDLKPSNIMLVDYGRGGRDFVKLLDFGIAQPLHPTELDLQTIQGLAGTPSNMSPEQTRKPFVGIPSDIYSAGTVMYEMLTGRPPFERIHGSVVDAQRSYTPESMRLLGLADLPVAVDDLVLQMLSKSEEMRPANCNEVKVRIERALSPWRRPPDSLHAGDTSGTPVTIPILESMDFNVHPAELKRMVQTIPQQEGQQAAVWEVYGVSGIGKTRFMHNLERAVQDGTGMDTYIFPFLGGDYPLEVLRTLVSGLVDQKSPGLDDMRDALLDTLKKTPIIRPEELVRRITELLFDPEKLLMLQGLRANILENLIFATVYDLLDAYSRLRPVCLCFDDLDRYHDMFGRFIAFLQSKAAEAYVPISIITFHGLSDDDDNRPGKPPKKAVDGVRRVVLKPLPMNRMQSYLDTLFPKPLQPSARRKLAELSEGRPGIAVEYCRYITSTQGFTESNGKIGFVNEAMLNEVPPTIEAMYEKRLELMQKDGDTGIQAVELLQRIALAEPYITDTALSRILETEGRLDLQSGMARLLDYLVLRGYVMRGSKSNPGILRLAHPLSGTVLRHAAIRKPRVQMLMSVAYVMETSFTYNTPDYYKRLAFLYEQAGYISKAVDFHVLLGRQFYSDFAFAMAAEHFRTARGMMRKAGMTDTPKWRLVCRELGRTLADMGDYEEAIKAYDLEITPQQVNKATPNELSELFEITRLLVETRDEKRSALILRHMTRRCEQTQANLMASTCHLMNARMYNWHGHANKAEKELKKAQELLEGYEITPVHWELALSRAELEMYRLNYDFAAKILNKALNHLGAPGMYAMESRALFYLGAVYLDQGRLDQAEDVFGKGYNLSSKYGFRKGMARHRINLAAVQTFKGMFDAAEKGVMDALHLNEKGIGDPLMNASAYITLSYLYCLWGKPDEAERNIHLSIKVSRKYGYAKGKAISLMNRAILRGMQRRWEDAQRDLDEALDLFARMNDGKGADLNPLDRPEVDYVKAGLLWHDGKKAAAMEMLDQAFTEFLDLNRKVEATRVRRTKERIDKGMGIFTLL